LTVIHLEAAAVKLSEVVLIEGWSISAARYDAILLIRLGTSRPADRSDERGCHEQIAETELVRAQTCAVELRVHGCFFSTIVIASGPLDLRLVSIEYDLPLDAHELPLEAGSGVVNLRLFELGERIFVDVERQILRVAEVLVADESVRLGVRSFD
jgi:hypothetical protein